MNASSVKPIIKSKSRVADHGEVFTPPHIVEDMLALVKDKVEQYQCRFLEPACGDGNFLVAILSKRLQLIDKNHRRNQPQWEIQAFFAVSSLYGIELLADNVLHCRRNLLSVFRFYYEDRRRNFWTADKYLHNNQYFQAIRFVIYCNIVQGNALKMCRTQNNGEDLPQPIIFSEWNTFQNNQIIRKEWVYQNLVNKDTPNNQTQSFRQPENNARHTDPECIEGEVSLCHKEKDSSLSFRMTTRQPEKDISVGKNAHHTAVQNNGVKTVQNDGVNDKSVQYQQGDLFAVINDVQPTKNIQGDLFADLLTESDFRQPEKNTRHTERSEVSHHSYEEKDSSLSLRMTTRQPEKDMSVGKNAHPTAAQNDGKKIVPNKETTTPFTQTREFSPVNYWEISEAIYKKLSKQRRHKKGGRNA